MKAKYKRYLTDQIYGILTISLDIPKEQKMLAEALGIGDQEQVNLVGQDMQTILSLLGNTEEA